MPVIIQNKNTHTDLLQYLHATSFSPVKSTFAKVVKKIIIKPWPGLTPEFLKHLPTSVSTVQGHIHQER